MQQSLPSSPNWDELELLYAEGASDVEIACALHITMRKFQKMYQDSKPFADWVDMGNTIASAWWVSQGRLHLKNKTFNSSLWGFNMKNRYAWAEKSELSNLADKDDSDLEKLKRELQATMRIIAKDNPDLLSGKHLQIVGGNE